MKTYRLVYNPYTVETKMYAMKEKKMELFDKDSSMAPIYYQRIQKWLDPDLRNDWQGFFAELQEVCGEDKIRLEFLGTDEDYQELNSAYKKYAVPAGFYVEIIKLLNKPARLQASGEYKLMQIQNLIKNAEKNADKSVLPDEILNYLKKAIDPYFEINVTAPVSSGKSTLQNAILGRRILPTSSLAKTAVLTHTRINNAKDDFYAESETWDGSTEKHGRVTQTIIEKLNDELDPQDPKKETALRRAIYLEGPSAQFEDCALDLVFIDTPGGNNAMNEKHKDVMRSALYAENKNMILFVFSVNTISHENTVEALKEAAEAMQHGFSGKMNQDRFLFVCTSCDMIADNLDGTEKTIRQVLASVGITEPNLFMVSALAVELLRTQDYNRRMKSSGMDDRIDILTKKNNIDLQSCVELLAQPECDLYARASIPDSKKQELGLRINELKAEFSRISDLLEEAKYDEDLEIDVRKLSREQRAVGEELAILNSGIPSLEFAIREYLNRYAIPMKIQQAAESVRAKAEEVEAIKNVHEKWTATEDAAKEAFEQVKFQKLELERSKILKKDRSKIEKLSIDRNAIDQKMARALIDINKLSHPSVVGAKTMTIGSKSGLWIKESAAKQYVTAVNRSLVSTMERIVDDMAQYFNDTVVKTCNDAMEDYREHIEALKDSGAFDLAGLNIERTLATAPAIPATVDLTKMIHSKREIVGSKQVAKSGFFNAVKRFFGSSSGYSTVAVYDNVRYVFVLDIFTTQVAKMRTTFQDWVEEETGRLHDNVNGLREEVMDRMDTLDEFIANEYEKYLKKLSDSEQLNKDAEQWKQQSEWLEGFLAEIESLLDIEALLDEQKG